ncbi:putative DNA-binding domain-containing protein, partial [Vibrio makurazakiensis]|uniref:HvfC/BufC family peptide modification chaperone n=1 Tax=Vibrio makurazakiensis TaxID=2910250 RepID=UPI003D0B81E9
MVNPPQEMVRLTHQLSEAIRSPHSRNKSSEQILSACRYGEFIRDNVFAVVTNTFPLFCEQLSENELNQFIDEFVETHSADEPEFHHIATELVKFVASIIQQIELNEELP